MASLTSPVTSLEDNLSTRLLLGRQPQKLIALLPMT